MLDLTMPRIALLLSGLPRQWRRSLPTQLKLFAEPIDVFFHFWDVIDYQEKVEMVDLLRPKAYCFEPPRDFSKIDSDPRVKRDSISVPSRLLSQYYSWHQVGRLFEPSIEQYDLGIRSRTDLQFIKSMNSIRYRFGGHDLLVPWWETGGLLSDIWAIGGVNAILYYHKMYEKVQDYAKSTLFNAELLIMNHLRQQPQIKVSTTSRKLFFVRRPHMEHYSVEQAMSEHAGQNKWLDPEVIAAHKDFFRHTGDQAGEAKVERFAEFQLVELNRKSRGNHGQGNVPRPKGTDENKS